MKEPRKKSKSAGWVEFDKTALGADAPVQVCSARGVVAVVVLNQFGQVLYAHSRRLVEWVPAQMMLPGPVVFDTAGPPPEEAPVMAEPIPQCDPPWAGDVAG